MTPGITPSSGVKILSNRSGGTLQKPHFLSLITAKIRYPVGDEARLGRPLHISHPRSCKHDAGRAFAAPSDSTDAGSTPLRCSWVLNLGGISTSNLTGACTGTRSGRAKFHCRLFFQFSSKRSLTHGAAYIPTTSSHCRYG